MEYAIVIEKSATGFGAYVPDLPGCVATAKTEAEVRKLIREGINIHLDEMRLDGEPIPVPTSRVEYVEVAEAALAT
jgi:predicted RNase H-like HicB family nuclease